MDFIDMRQSLTLIHKKAEVHPMSPTSWEKVNTMASNICNGVVQGNTIGLAHEHSEFFLDNGNLDVLALANRANSGS